jgi:hypothetical protein
MPNILMSYIVLYIHNAYKGLSTINSTCEVCQVIKSIKVFIKLQHIFFNSIQFNSIQLKPI